MRAGLGAAKGINNVPLTLDGTETFAVDFTKGLTPLVDQGDGYTFDADDGDHTHTDFEGIIRQINAEEVRCQGSRRVENMSIGLDAYFPSLATITKGIDDPFGGYTAHRITATTIGTATYSKSAVGQYPKCFADDKANYSVYVRVPSTAKAGLDIIIKSPNSIGTIALNNFVPRDTWVRVCSGASTILADTLGGEGIEFQQHDLGDYVDIAFPQFENVTGQSNQNPSEYVSVMASTGEPPYLPDPEFDDPVPWNISNPAGSITGGAFTVNDSSPALSFTVKSRTAQDLRKFKIGDLIYVEFEIANYGRGSVIPTVGGVSTGSYSSDGVKRKVIRVTNDSTNLVNMTVSSGFDGTWLCQFDILYFRIYQIDHGSNVDGVKYFDTINGNTVSSNIVAEATGKRIQSSVRKGTLIEGSATNTISDSEDFSAANWSISPNTALSAGILNPANRNSTKLYSTDLTVGKHQVFDVNATGTSQSVFSVYAKAAELSHVCLTFYDVSATPTTGSAHFDLINGVVTTETNITNSIITHAGNGWYRCSINRQSGFTDDVFIGLSNGTSDLISVAVNSGIYISMAQVEDALKYPSSYIPTSGASVTRTIEILDYGVENYNNTGWLECEFYISENSLDRFGTYPCYISIQDETAAYYLEVYIAAINQAGVISYYTASNSNSTTITQVGRNKICVTWDAPDILVYSLNGKTALTNSVSNAVPPSTFMSTIRVGTWTDGTNKGSVEAPITNIKMGSTLLSNSECVERSKL